MLFDGADDFVSIAHNDAYLMDAGTVEFWFNADDLSGFQGLFSRDSEGFNAGDLSLMLMNNTLSASMQSSSQTYSLTTTVSANAWHHVAYSFGAEGMNLYLDGSLAGSDLSYSGGFDTSQPIILAAHNMYSTVHTHDDVRWNFGGKMSNVTLWDEQLSVSMINQRYLGVSNPEPSTYLILGSSLLIIAYQRRKRQRAGEIA